MKAKRVIVTERAAAQLNATADWISERAPETAEHWFEEFAAVIQTLDTRSGQFPVARESRRLPLVLRECSLDANVNGEFSTPFEVMTCWSWQFVTPHRMM